MGVQFNRREFIGATAAGAGAVLLAGRMAERAAFGAAETWPQSPAVKVYKVYVGRTGTAWPKPAWKPAPEVAKFEVRLAEMQAKLPGIQFVGGDLVQSAEDAACVAGKLRDADGVLLMHLSLSTLGDLKAIVDAGKPTVCFSQPFSGHEWMYVNEWRKAGAKLALICSRELDDIVPAVSMLRVPALMAKSRVLAVPGNLAGSKVACSLENVKAKLGTDVVAVPYERIIKTHESIDAKLAEAEAEQYWLKPAKRIVEPSRDEILKSARMFMAMKAVMAAERAQAITINCLGGMPIDKLGYPCLGFSKLDDIGLVGACEADIDSTLTKLMFTYAFGVPGFITDPLFDTAKNAIIHAHCTSATRMDGPTGERAPFTIRTHTDDDKGAALEVEMRVGQMITCAKLVNLDTMLLTTGKITEVPDFDDRGCRTQIVTEVADAQRMLDNWGGGLLDGMMPMLHRVVFYGDHTKGVKNLASLMGFKVVEII